MTEIDMNAMETWVSLTKSRVYWQVTDSYNRIAYRSVQGKGRTVRIKVSDRLAIMETSPDNNPFINGMLAPFEDGAQVAVKDIKDEELRASEAMLDDELRKFFKMRQPNLGSKLQELADVNLTRLIGLVTPDTPNSVTSALAEERKRRNPGQQMSDYDTVESTGRSMAS